MGVEMMSTQVYITKNVDAAAEIQDILTKQYGSHIYDHTSKTLQIPSELHHYARHDSNNMRGAGAGQ
jgi:hypothetical protein